MSQTVLVIDDSPDIHRLLDVRLKPEGLVIHHALDAMDGVAQASRRGRLNHPSPPSSVRACAPR